LDEREVSAMRSTLPIGSYEDVVGDYLAAGDVVWLKDKKRFKEGGLCAGYDVLSRCGQIISLGNRLGHQSTWYQLNYFVSNQDVPEEARPIIEETMLAEFSFHENNIVAYCNSDDVCKNFCTLIMYKSNNVHIWIMLCMIMSSAHCVMYIIATLL
jgi:hypothetical protein